MTQATEKAAEKAKETVGGDGGGSSLTSKLIVPAAAAPGTLVSGYAAKKVPELLREHVLPRLEQKGEDEAEGLGRRAVEGAREAASERGGLAGKAAGKLLGGGDESKGEKQPAQGWGRGRRLPIQCSVDVAVPVDVAYNQWTQLEEFPKFMHRVEQVEQRDDETLVWHENIWHVRRSWRAEIVEQTPDERIVWHSESRGGHSGVVSFHPLSERLTRIEVNIDFQPEGVFEKLGSGLKFHRRAIKTDLQRFKAFVEMRNEETGKWRGEIHEEEKNPARAEPQGEQEQDDESRGDDGGRDPEEARREREERRRERQKATAASKR